MIFNTGSEKSSFHYTSMTTLSDRFWLVSTNRRRSRLSVDFELDFEFDNLCTWRSTYRV